MPRALLHDVKCGHTHHLGAIHMRMEHLRVEGDESIGEQLG
jgi:hypothetical protein